MRTHNILEKQLLSGCYIKITSLFIGLAPKVEIETSTFGEDWYKMLESPKHADVMFVLESEHKLDAHKIVLSSASKVFERIFAISSATQVCTITKLSRDMTKPTK